MCRKRPGHQLHRVGAQIPGKEAHTDPVEQPVETHLRIKQMGMDIDGPHAATVSSASRLAWLKSFLPLPSFGIASTGISSAGRINGLSPD